VRSPCCAGRTSLALDLTLCCAGQWALLLLSPEGQWMLSVFLETNAEGQGSCIAQLLVEQAPSALVNNKAKIKRIN